ncbi:rhodanese-like domain-containing protein [Vogesella sp. LIG4]|uniref:rhodanese-like domain-containing protein n=1 Tax=Vogesella sp. LIG4 TaxID=1192162 RepID=UPI0008200D74|nr:rhodanese-like domain-containing protein [Vogesella sp. LIG4]SCK30978.1 Rhodanese-related sulfurtransferase [Vogesella sp. LIG4]
MLKHTAHDLAMAARAQIQECSPQQLQQQLASAMQLVIDVREPDEYAAGHLAGAVNIPRGVLEFRLSADPALADGDRPLLLYCKSGGRAALAARALQEMGYCRVVSLAGGLDAWLAGGLPLAQAPMVDFS